MFRAALTLLRGQRSTFLVSRGREAFTLSADDVTKAAVAEIASIVAGNVLEVLVDDFFVVALSGLERGHCWQEGDLVLFLFLPFWFAVLSS